MTEAVVERPQWRRKHNVGLNRVLPYTLHPTTHLTHRADQLVLPSTDNIMEETRDVAVERAPRCLRSVTTRTRRLEAGAPRGRGEGADMTHGQRTEAVGQHSHTGLINASNIQGIDAVSLGRIGREVVLLERYDSQANAQQRYNRETVSQQPRVRRANGPPINNEEIRTPERQSGVMSTSSARRAIALPIHSGEVSTPRRQTGVLSAPRGRVRVASTPHSRVRATGTARSRVGIVSNPRGRGRVANVVHDYSREMSAPQAHSREASSSHSRVRGASAPGHDREAEGPQRHRRQTRARSEQGGEVPVRHRPCPRVRPRPSVDQGRIRGIRGNGSNEERVQYSLRPRVERPNYSEMAGHRRRAQPSWQSQMRTQMRQYMDEIFAAYVNAMLFGTHKREVKDLPEVEITEEQVDTGLKCSVCLLDFVVCEVVYKLPCDHVYHKNCITPWLEQNDNCPMCRRPVEEEESGDDILPDDDSGNQRARFRIVVGDADVTVIAHDSTNDTTSSSDSDSDIFTDFEDN